MEEYYTTIKALHIISVIAWMSGLLYLPRLFVYHTQVKAGSEASELFKVMERKLMRLIMNPAMICAWVFGLMLVHIIDGFQPDNGWFHGKFTLVVALSVVHMMLSKYRKAFARDANVKSERFFRIINEVPAVIMVVVVFLVVLKP